MPFADPNEQLVVEVFVRDVRRATDFYRSLGGSPSMSAIFTFPAEER